ncbi:hypothetical protein AAFF_G00233460 [Aldrovandia affinis]|uniref:Uncharacterized protein n=1 Tax=Aldrovandia affinis TaxID=143900 RepID=A0AAD7QZW3_9TELE|nr:hypothetical protein AAFF_G00233460 [Aldrovandia affinis]
MNGSVVFSKLDLKWGYHQLELTPESREITTFAIHNGVYRYKRLLFGVSSASEQYQHEIAAALAGIEEWKTSQTASLFMQGIKKHTTNAYTQS